MKDLSDLVQRLHTIEEELSDLAIDCLRASVADGDPSAAADEKVITRARRAVEKAAGLLAGMPDSSPDD